MTKQARLSSSLRSTALKLEAGSGVNVCADTYAWRFIECPCKMHWLTKTADCLGDGIGMCGLNYCMLF